MRWLVVFSTMISLRFASADLVWDDPVQEFQRLPTDKELNINFAFRNTGKDSVTILKASASCGSCTSATVPERPIQPGEKGVLAVKFVFGTRHGLQSKSVSVLTDDTKTTQLTFKCLISDEPVTMQPSLLSWKVGGKADPKTVSFAIEPKDKVKIIAVASTNPRVTATLSTVKEGERYAVSIQPADTAKAESSQVFVQTNFPADGPRAYTVQVQVK